MKVEPYSHNVGTCYRCHQRRGADHLRPVVREDEASGRGSHPGRQGRGDQVRPRAVQQDLSQLDGECPRLVHFPSAVVGSSDSRMDVCRLRPHHRVPGGCLQSAKSAAAPTSSGTPTCWIPGSPPLCGPSETLGWPEKTEDLDYFYPTDVLVTGYDIIFFWVARMIFSGCEHTGKTPFHTVLIHGLVRDDQGTQDVQVPWQRH